MLGSNTIEDDDDDDEDDEDEEDEEDEEGDRTRDPTPGGGRGSNFANFFSETPIVLRIVCELTRPLVTR